MLIQHALHSGAYLDVAKYYYKIWETPSVKEDESGKGRVVCSRSTHPLVSLMYGFQALEHIIYYVVLAPHDNEQSDMLYRLYNDPALPKLELH